MPAEECLWRRTIVHSTCMCEKQFTQHTLVIWSDFLTMLCRPYDFFQIQEMIAEKKKEEKINRLHNSFLTIGKKNLSPSCFLFVCLFVFSTCLRIYRVTHSHCRVQMLRNKMLNLIFPYIS